MDKRSKAIEQLKQFRKPNGDIFSYAQVTKITGDTCSVKIGDLELTDVRLKATDDGSSDKLVIYPLVGSKVIVCANNGSLNDLFVCKVDDPERILYKHKNVMIDVDGKNGKIILNEGKLGGLIKIEELVSRFNKLENFIKEWRMAYDIHMHATAGTGSPSPPSVLFSKDPETTERNPLENPNVKH